MYRNEIDIRGSMERPRLSSVGVHSGLDSLPEDAQIEQTTISIPYIDVVYHTMSSIILKLLLGSTADLNQSVHIFIIQIRLLLYLCRLLCRLHCSRLKIKPSRSIMIASVTLQGKMQLKVGLRFLPFLSKNFNLKFFDKSKDQDFSYPYFTTTQLSSKIGHKKVYFIKALHQYRLISENLYYLFILLIGISKILAPCVEFFIFRVDNLTLQKFKCFFQNILIF